MKYLPRTGLILSVIILAVLMFSVGGCVKLVKVKLAADKVEAAVGEPVHFFNESEIDFTSCTWDFGDGGTSTELNPSHAYKEPGNYFITLVVFDGDEQYFDTMEVIISGSPSGTSPANAPSKDSQVIGSSNLNISRIEMCTGPIQRDECRPQPGAAYYTGDTASVWFEITGFRVQGSGGNYEAWVRWRRYSLYAPDGGLIMTDNNVNDWHEFTSSADNIEAFHAWWNIGVVESVDPRGTYRVEIEVEDILSGQVANRTITFTLK